MSSAQDPQNPPPDESPEPLNRAARRAKRKGKPAGGAVHHSNKDDQSRNSQVMAQQKFKGRRGNR